MRLAHGDFSYLPSNMIWRGRASASGCERLSSWVGGTTVEVGDRPELLNQGKPSVNQERSYLACCIIFYDSAQRYEQFRQLHNVTRTKNTIINIRVRL